MLQTSGKITLPIGTVLWSGLNFQLIFMHYLLVKLWSFWGNSLTIYFRVYKLVHWWSQIIVQWLDTPCTHAQHYITLHYRHTLYSHSHNNNTIVWWSEIVLLQQFPLSRLVWGTVLLLVCSAASASTPPWLCPSWPTGGHHIMTCRGNNGGTLPFSWC